MTPLRLMPDIEADLIAYYATVPDLQALVDTRIYPELPSGVIYPALTARNLSNRTTMPRWLEACTIELAGWTHRDIAHARRMARDICETAVAATYQLINRTLGTSVVMGPQAVTGPRSVPDSIDPGITNPRFIAEVSFTYHPK
jgi:hypothetical protein